MALVIVSSARVSDIIGRYGGEEFCVFMPDVDINAFIPFADRIKTAIYAAQPNELTVSVSVGAVAGKMSHKAEKEIHEILISADENLSKAKRGGKNQVAL